MEEINAAIKTQRMRGWWSLIAQFNSLVQPLKKLDGC